MDNHNGYDPNQYQNIFGNRRSSFEQQLQTNKWNVQSLQDALSRYAPPNSCGCYHCVLGDQEYEYEVYTDYNGQKTYKVFKRTLCENSNTQQPELADILDKIKALEEKINAKSTTTSADGVK